MPLTEQQHTAVHMRDASVALSAGAGCGKTHVLTERFLSHVDPTTADPAKLHQLIAITFTDAAAREMRSRIRKACYDRLQTPGLSESEQDDWLRLLRQLDIARVSTIHAFCTSILRSHAAEAGLDPTFGVLEQGEADMLRLAVMDDVLRGKLENLDDDTLDLAATFELGKLKEQITILLGRRHEPAFTKWLVKDDEELAEKTEELVAIWKQFHDTEGFRNSLRGMAEKASVDEMINMLESVEPAKPAFRDAKATLLDLLPKLTTGDLQQSDLDRIRDNARVQTVCTAKDWSDEELYKRYKKSCETLRKCIDGIQPWKDAAAREAAQLGLKLLRLARVVVDRYQDRKLEAGKLDFDDLLTAAHQLLSDPKNEAIRRELSGDLRLLLVDEFQDTDPLQIELVKIICGKGFKSGRLFFVGDFKQSIYRFRGAQPPEFLQLRAEVPESGRLPLTLNFRSQPGVLDFVNALFHGSFAEEYDRLLPHREGAENSPCVEFLWTIDANKNSKSKGAVEAARRAEAAKVARRLRELMDPDCQLLPVVDKETKQRRRVQPGDVAILFRALSDVRIYEEALRDHGLDYYLVGGHAFYAQQEIYDVLNLLRAVASTADEMSLAGALRSPFFALADESLFWLSDSADSLNAGLFAETLPPQLSDVEHGRAAAAAETLAHLRAVKDRIPIAALLNRALERAGYDAVVLGEFLGERKLANLQKLIEQARAADGSGMDLNAFIVELAEFIARPPQEPLASTCPETADVIRLMTIHRAKGLEFPVVVVPDLDRPPNRRTPAAALDRDLGPLVMPPAEDDEKFATGMSLFTARENFQELEERKRLLYVACTRAADYLILSSSIESHDKQQSDWMQLIAGRFDLATGECRADLPDELTPPSVHISPSEADESTVRRSRGPDLLKVLDEAQQLAADGMGIIPREVEPIPADSTARRQFSFSRLNGQLIRTDSADPDDASSPPAFATATSLDPRGLGTLVHDLLARVDLGDTKGIREWSEHLAPAHVIQNAADAASTAAELVSRFVASKRGSAIAGAESIEREVEFIMAWPPDGTSGTYLRGYIDCLYRDPERGLVLVDYKTDHVAPSNVANYAERYAMQLYVYALAIERALGKSPDELMLHFLRPGAEHVFQWNDVNRRAAMEMVNQAIESATSGRPPQVAS